jgi:hypothetical protein
VSSACSQALHGGRYGNQISGRGRIPEVRKPGISIMIKIP